MAEIVLTEEVWRRLSEAVRRVEGQVRSLTGRPLSGGTPSAGIQVVRVTSTTPSDGRYPGKVQDFDPATNAFSDLGDIWVVDVAGNPLNTGYYLGRRYGEAADRLVFAVNGAAAITSVPSGETLTFGGDGTLVLDTGTVSITSPAVNLGSGVVFTAQSGADLALASGSDLIFQGGSTVTVQDSAVWNLNSTTWTVQNGDTWTVTGTGTGSVTFASGISVLTLAPTTLVIPSVLYGSTASAGVLVLGSTTHSTKGGIKIESGNWLTVPELSAAPGTPASGFGSLYTLSDGLYFKDDSGAEYKLNDAGGSGTLTDATGGSQVISSDGVWTDTSASISLDAGTYWIVGEANGYAAISATPPGEIRMRLWNSTDGVQVGQERVLVSVTTTGSTATGSGAVSAKVTLGGTKTIKVQVWRSGGGPIWTTSAADNSRISALPVS